MGIELQACSDEDLAVLLCLVGQLEGVRQQINREEFDEVTEIMEEYHLRCLRNSYRSIEALKIEAGDWLVPVDQIIGEHFGETHEDDRVSLSENSPIVPGRIGNEPHIRRYYHAIEGLFAVHSLNMNFCGKIGRAHV